MSFLVLLIGIASVLADPLNYCGVHCWNMKVKFFTSSENRHLVPLSTHTPFNTALRPVSEYAFVNAAPASSHYDFTEQNDNPWMPPYLKNVSPLTAWYVTPTHPLAYNYEYDMYSTAGDGGATDSAAASPYQPNQHYRFQPPQWSDPSYNTFHHTLPNHLVQIHSNIQYVPYLPMYKPDFWSLYGAQYRQPYAKESQFYVVDIPWIYIRHLNMHPEERKQIDVPFTTETVPRESIVSEIADEKGGCDVDVMLSSENDVHSTSETETQKTMGTETTVKSDDFVMVVVVEKETETPFTLGTRLQAITTIGTAIKSENEDVGGIIQEETETPSKTETVQQETATSETSVKSDDGNVLLGIETEAFFITKTEQQETAITETSVKCDNEDVLKVVEEESGTPFMIQTKLEETTTARTTVKSYDGVVLVVEDESEASTTIATERQETIVSDVTYDDGYNVDVMLALEADAQLKTETELRETTTTAETAAESENGDVVVAERMTETSFSTETEQQQTITENIGAGTDDEEKTEILRIIEIFLKHKRRHLSEPLSVAQKLETLDHVIRALSPKIRKIFEDVRDKIPSNDSMTILDEKIMDMLNEYLFT